MLDPRLVLPLLLTACLVQDHRVNLSGAEHVSVRATYDGVLFDESTLELRLAEGKPKAKLMVEGAVVTITMEGAASERAVPWLDAMTRRGRLSVHRVVSWARPPAPAPAPAPVGEAAGVREDGDVDSLLIGLLPADLPLTIGGPTPWDAPSRLALGADASELPAAPSGFVRALLCGEADCEVLLLEPPSIEVSMLRATEWTPDGTGRGALTLALTEADGRAIEALTGRSIGERVAVLVDGEALIAPKVVEPITGGRIQMSVSEAQYARVHPVELDARRIGFETVEISAR